MPPPELLKRVHTAFTQIHPRNTHQRRPDPRNDQINEQRGQSHDDVLGEARAAELQQTAFWIKGLQGLVIEPGADGPERGPEGDREVEYGDEDDGPDAVTRQQPISALLPVCSGRPAFRSRFGLDTRGHLPSLNASCCPGPSFPIA